MVAQKSAGLGLQREELPRNLTLGALFFYFIVDQPTATDQPLVVFQKMMLRT
jgi:hypothetical protein